MSSGVTSRLFTYGTLQLAHVQRALFGRAIEGEPAVLAGYARETIEMTDETVLGLSRTATHAILRATGDRADRIEGKVYALSEAELAAADAYETDAYARLVVELEDGSAAFVYARP